MKELKFHLFDEVKFTPKKRRGSYLGTLMVFMNIPQTAKAHNVLLWVVNNAKEGIIVRVPPFSAHYGDTVISYALKQWLFHLFEIDGNLDLLVKAIARRKVGLSAPYEITKKQLQAHYVRMKLRETEQGGSEHTATGTMQDARTGI